MDKIRYQRDTPGYADHWRFQLPAGTCEIRWYGRKPTWDDVQTALDALTLAKRALEMPASQPAGVTTTGEGE